eukprot:545854-Hanusia_phi.AAC.2
MEREEEDEDVEMPGGSGRSLRECTSAVDRVGRGEGKGQVEEELEQEDGGERREAVKPGEAL